MPTRVIDNLRTYQEGISVRAIHSTSPETLSEGQGREMAEFAKRNLPTLTSMRPESLAMINGHLAEYLGRNTFLITRNGTQYEVKIGQEEK